MRKLKNENGLVIIEATIVFPVTFLVIFLLIFVGNAYFEKCKVEAIVTEVTLNGAAYCADPMLGYVDETGALPEFEDTLKHSPDYIAPYRYFSGMAGVKSKIEEDLKARLGNVSTGLFSGMKPEPSETVITFDNNVVYSTFSVDLEYRVPVPVKLLGAKDIFILKVTTHAEAAVTDVPEFMRNVNMAEDYLEQTGVKEKFDEGKAKIKNSIDKAKEQFVK
ncbi:MAG: pilus assembly protein [Oscillospiraceae bacterium]|jgi:hypothetical protein|nr:pilus assembly protein [Oscillospiraceae bacterium]